MDGMLYASDILYSDSEGIIDLHHVQVFFGFKPRDRKEEALIL